MPKTEALIKELSTLLSKVPDSINNFSILYFDDGFTVLIKKGTFPYTNVGIALKVIDKINDQFIVKIIVSSNRVEIKRVFIDDYETIINHGMIFIGNCLDFPMFMRGGD